MEVPQLPRARFLFVARLLHKFDRYLEKENSDTEPGCRFDIHCHYVPRCLRSVCWRMENIAGASSSMVVMDA